MTLQSACILFGGPAAAAPGRAARSSQWLRRLSRRTLHLLVLLGYGVAASAAPLSQLPGPPVDSAPPEPTGPAPTAVILSAADGITYYRYELAPAGGGDSKLAPAVLTTWLVQSAPDAIARVAPDGSGILVRRDRRSADGQIVQQLIWVAGASTALAATARVGGSDFLESTVTKPVVRPAPFPAQQVLPLDTAALATGRGLTHFHLRSISGLQWPIPAAGPATRVLLRLTYEADGATSATKGAGSTEELLGWYDTAARAFSLVWTEQRMLGVDVSPQGNFIHLLTLRPQPGSGGAVQSGDGGDATVVLLDAFGGELPARVLHALRAVGYLYRGWIDDTHLLLKKSGQNQAVIYDAGTDTVSAPVGLSDVWDADLAPDRGIALTWKNDEAVQSEAPAALNTVTGTALTWDSRAWGAAPVAIGGWSLDSRYFLLEGGRSERGNYSRLFVIGTAPYRATEIPLPSGTAFTSARFVYESPAKIVH